MFRLCSLLQLYLASYHTRVESSDPLGANWYSLSPLCAHTHHSSTKRVRILSLDDARNLSGGSKHELDSFAERTLQCKTRQHQESVCTVVANQEQFFGRGQNLLGGDCQEVGSSRYRALGILQTTVGTVILSPGATRISKEACGEYPCALFKL
jgi:hypothetical protein